MHEKFKKRKRKSLPYPSQVHQPPLPYPSYNMHTKSKKGEKTTFFGWKMKVKLLFIYIYIIFGVHLRLVRLSIFTCDDELNSVQFLMFQSRKQNNKKKKSTKKSIKRKKQMKLIMDIGLLGFEFSSVVGKISMNFVYKTC